MAEGFEPYHVPQQSRRDKLRFAAHHNDHNLHSLLYDPSLISSHFMIHGCPVKDEAINLMGSVSSSSAAHYLDPHSDSHPLVNPTSIHDFNSAGNEPFLYHPRDFEQPSYNAPEVFVFKPEPLSLSLSSHNTRHHQLELNLQRYGGGYVVPGIVGGGGSGSASDDVSRSSAPLGPFTGYASILKGSRFLKPAQQLLEEFCDVGHVICAEKFAADSSLMEQNPPPLESLTGGGGDDPRSSSDGGSANQRKKSTLISMLDEVYRRYKQYYQQMQAVAASFECVSGLGNAAPYANQALKTMSKHFKCLKDAISDQLQFTNKGHGKDEAARFGNTDKGFYSQRAVNNSGYVESQPVWRPQRGLPERAVTVLRAWLFEHFLHPYPTDTDKQMLAKQTGLSRSQVSNWFINARVRLWKPMVEEIHMLETRQAHKGFQREGGGGNNNGPSDHLKPVNTDPPENPSSSQRLQDGGPVRMEEPLNLAYNGMTGHGSSSVSLTLGLHQNNCIGLSEPFPIHAAQRFGLSLEGNSEGYVMGGFEAQHGHFGREGVGGQLLHDFVG